MDALLQDLNWGLFFDFSIQNYLPAHLGSHVLNAHDTLFALLFSLKQMLGFQDVFLTGHRVRYSGRFSEGDVFISNVSLPSFRGECISICVRHPHVGGGLLLSQSLAVSFGTWLGL